MVQNVLLFVSYLSPLYLYLLIPANYTESGNAADGIEKQIEVPLQ